PSAECCVNLILVFVVHNAWVCVLLSCNFMVTGYIRAECHLLRYLSVAPCLSHTHPHTHTHTHTHTQTYTCTFLPQTHTPYSFASSYPWLSSHSDTIHTYMLLNTQTYTNTWQSTDRSAD